VSFAHGDNVRELELMVEYGMTPLAALRSATSGNAKAFHLDDRLGRIATGLLADLVAVQEILPATCPRCGVCSVVMKDGARVR
jgi:imidazolonepropionase-like amidohydrolase